MLEARRLLTAYVVTDTRDVVDPSDGLLSLREAITAANANTAAGDSISFALPSRNREITLTAGQLNITDDLSINGNFVEINGNNASRIFNITTAEAVTLTSLRLRNGNDSGVGGGAIYTENADLTLRDMSLSDNRATGASGSGGALFQASGSVKIEGSSFYSNTAVRAGGAIEIVVGDLLVQNTALGDVNPEAGNASNEGAANPGNGGALHVTGAANVTIVGGSVSNNIASAEGGGLWNSATGTMTITGGTRIIANIAQGAAADNGGGGVFNNGGTLIIENAQIDNNLATGAAGSGGGLFSVAGNVTVTDTNFENNTAIRAGGGIEVTGGKLVLSGVKLVENDAGPDESGMPGNGGGLHVTGVARVDYLSGVVTGNKAASEGGGLWNSAGGTMYLYEVNVTRNVAYGAAADNGGGGVFNDGGTLTIDRSTITINTARGEAGSGGGLLSVAGKVAISNTTVSDNQAVRAGGGIEIIDGSLSFRRGQLNDNGAGTSEAGTNPGNGGGLHVTGTAGTIVSFFKSVATGNVAASQGGALWNQNGSFLTVDGSTLYNNIAFGTNVRDGGGAIFDNGGSTSINNSTLFENAAPGDNNAAAGSGGAVSSSGELLVNRSNLRNNTASRAGGAIEMFNGDLRVMRSIVRNNTARPEDFKAGNGGGVHLTGNGNTALISRTDLRNNLAGGEGGALWNAAGSTMRVEGSTLARNVAYDDNTGGGGILNNGGDLTLFATRLILNVADGQNARGGGLYNKIDIVSEQGGIVRIEEGSLFNRNFARGNGGGIFNDASLIVDNTSINFNRAGVTGGGIFTNSGATTDLLSDAAVVRNTPNNFAGSGTVM
jgi:hypothetical protein